MGTSKILFLADEKNPPWRIQWSALCWRVAAFLWPSYAVWQGLHLRWQAWYTLLLWLLFAAGFLFFVPQEGLQLLTQQPRRSVLSRLRQWLLRLNERKAQPKQGPQAIFGDYANDGRGSLAPEPKAEDEDDGITIEEYLQGRQTKPPRKRGFDWNWQHTTPQEWTPKPKPKLRLPGQLPPRRPSLRAWAQRFLQLWRDNWLRPWQQALPQRRQRRDWQLLFWLCALLVGPAIYWWLAAWGLDGHELAQRMGLSAVGNGVSLLLVLCAGLLGPLLQQLQCRKLFASLAGGPEELPHLVHLQLTQKRLVGAFRLLIEGGMILALALWLGMLAFASALSSSAATLAAVTAILLVLGIAANRIGTLLCQRFVRNFPAFLFRQLCYLSATLLPLLLVIPAQAGV